MVILYQRQVTMKMIMRWVLSEGKCTDIPFFTSTMSAEWCQMFQKWSRLPGCRFQNIIRKERFRESPKRTRRPHYISLIQRRCFSTAIWWISACSRKHRIICSEGSNTPNWTVPSGDEANDHHNICQGHLCVKSMSLNDLWSHSWGPEFIKCLIPRDRFWDPLRVLHFHEKFIWIKCLSTHKFTLVSAVGH